MSPLDRIAQLNAENALLRSQLRDAQEQAKRDSETIARLVAHQNERRMSLALEIADALKSRGFWIPRDLSGPDIISAVARVAEELKQSLSPHA